MANDLSGDEAPAEAEFIKIFTDLCNDEKEIKKISKKLDEQVEEEIKNLEAVFAPDIEELSLKMMELQKKLEPYIEEINDKFKPKRRKCKREDQRLNLDFEEAWDNFFKEHPHYKGRSMRFDTEDKVFRFDEQKGVNYNNIMGLGGAIDQLDSFLRAQGFQIAPLEMEDDDLDDEDSQLPKA